MAKVLLVLKVFFLLFTSEVLSVSVAETLFIALSEKMNESLQKINARLDRIENIIEMNWYRKDTGNDVKDDMGKENDIYSEIMKANQRFKKAITSEKRHVRAIVKGFEEQFHELKTDVKHIISGFNKTMKDSKDNMVGKMELKVIQDRVTIMENNQNNQENAIKKLESTMTSSNSQRESEISSLDNRVTTWQNAQKNTITELEGRMTSLNNQRDSDVSSLENRVTTLNDAQQNTIKTLERRMTSLNNQRESKVSSLEHRITTLNDQRESDISSLTSRVTTLYDKQVCFHVSMFSKKEYSRGSTIIFDQVMHNPGAAYNKITGQFKAPYTGNYLFSMSVEATSNKKAFAVLKDNGFKKMYAHANIGKFVTSSNVCVTFMNEGDVAWIESYNGDTEFWSGQFTGVFLY